MTAPSRTTGATHRGTTMPDHWLDEDPAGTTNTAEPLLNQVIEWPDRVQHLTPGLKLRDLSYATALAEATERMDTCPDTPALLHMVAAEAATLLPADGTAILTGSRNGWQPLVTPLTHLSSEADYAPGWAIATARAGLLDPGYLPDLDYATRWNTRQIDEPSNWPPWRSLLVAELPCPLRKDELRLLWYSHQPAAFDNHLDVATLFARHAASSLQSTLQRDHLNGALETRARIGQALGILMSRHRLSSQEAFDLLRRQSQLRNIKMHKLAEELLTDGDLRSPTSPQTD